MLQETRENRIGQEDSKCEQVAEMEITDISKVVRVGPIEVILEETLEGENESRSYLVGDRTATAKALRQKWACLVCLRDSKETGVTGVDQIGESSRRQAQRGLGALQARLRTMAFTLCAKRDHYSFY